MTRPPFRQYYINRPVATGTQGHLSCNFSCLYTNLYLYVVVSATLPLQGIKLARARSEVVKHFIDLIGVPSEKLHRVIYCERYTYLADDEWLLVNITGNTPLVEAAPDRLVSKLQTELLDKIDQ